MTKVCTKCCIEKDIEVFSKDKRVKSGVRSCCKLCCVQYKKQYYQDNREKAKQYRENNKEKLQQYLSIS